MNFNLSASSSFGATNDSTEFRYVHSCDLSETWVQVKIGTLEGSALPRLNYEHLLEDPLMKFCGRNQDIYPDLMIEAVIVDGTPPAFGGSEADLSNRTTELHLPVTTSYKHFTKRWEWNEWIKLPLKYSDLPRSAQLCLTVFDCGGSKNKGGKSNLRTAIGGTTISLFGKKGVLRQGQMDLRVWAETGADRSNPTTTPGKTSLIRSTSGEQLNQNPAFYHLSKLTKKYRSGKIQPVEWLDGLSFAEIEKVNSKEKERSNLLFLMVEFPEFRLKGDLHSVVYYEKENDTRNVSVGGGLPPVSGGVIQEYTLHNIFPPQSDIILLPDSEIEEENLVEAKHHRLARSARAVDTELKPDTAAVRNRLNEIAEYLPTRNLIAEEQDLVWRYRFYLASNKRALTKFVKCINWLVAREADQALDHIIRKWVPMDVYDALELLGPSFRHPGLRQYAVNRLSQATDSDLQLFLLQLVQALKYEPQEHQHCTSDIFHNARDTKAPKANSNTSTGTGEVSMEATICEELSALSIIENEETSSARPPTSNRKQNRKTMLPQHSMASSPRLQNSSYSTIPESSRGGLAQFLIGRACRNDVIANYFYWYLVIECEEYCNSRGNNTGDQEGENTGEDMPSMQSQDQMNAKELNKNTVPSSGTLSKEERVHNMYVKVLQKFRNALKNGPPEWQERLQFLVHQTKLVNKVVELMKFVKRDFGTRQKKTDRLVALLQDTESYICPNVDGVGRKQKVALIADQISNSSSKPNFKFNFVHFDPALKHPLDPNVVVKGIIPEESMLFKSSLTPARLTFLRDDNKKYVTIFKSGDDLRQDQLILQIITLMDRILKQENLDLKLTPYRVLATSSSHGFVQYIESTSVADILSTEGSIQNFFRKWNSSEAAPYGIHPEVMDTYVKSCAGYCVVTYLLGVGDRHFDNLLLTKSGKLFHIDFGYILGRDPKIMAPPMKLSKEMIEGFGGMQSDQYQEFRRECYTAFLSLRRYANLILNLFSLMVDASVPDIALEPEHTVRKVQENFRLDYSDEEAIRYMQELIDTSASAVFAAVLERVHKWAQNLRS